MDDEAVGEAAAELLDMRANRRVVAGSPGPAPAPDADRGVRDPGTSWSTDSWPGPVAGASASRSPAPTTSPRLLCRSIAPLFGCLMSSTTSPSGTTLAADQFTHRVVEAEFAFRVGSDVEPVEGGHTPATIAEHIDALIPSIEIVDHRFESWAVGALRVAADNAIHGWWLGGEPVTDWRGPDLASAAVTVTRNGELVTTGSGAAVLGHPLNVMAWLADELPRYGGRLRQGDVVTTGVATDVFEAVAGDSCVADFGPFGSVTVAFD